MYHKKFSEAIEFCIALFTPEMPVEGPDEIVGLDGKTHGLESGAYNRIEPATRRDSVATSLGFGTVGAYARTNACSAALDLRGYLERWNDVVTSTQTIEVVTPRLHHLPPLI